MGAFTKKPLSSSRSRQAQKPHSPLYCKSRKSALTPDETSTAITPPELPAPIHFAELTIRLALQTLSRYSASRAGDLSPFIFHVLALASKGLKPQANALSAITASVNNLEYRKIPIPIQQYFSWAFLTAKRKSTSDPHRLRLNAMGVLRRTLVSRLFAARLSSAHSSTHSSSPGLGLCRKHSAL